MADELEEALMSLGLEEYLVRFQDSGFKDWEALSKIAETQLQLLDVRLGHRRRLQRAIASGRLWPENTPLPMGPDLNQRIRDWLTEEVYAPETSEFTDSMPQTSMTAPVKANLTTQSSGSQSSSDNSSSQNTPSEGKIPSETTPRSRDTRENIAGSRSATGGGNRIRHTGQGVT